MHKYIKDFLLDYTDISEYYNHLIDRTKNLQSVGVTNEWLVDNFYLIVEYKNDIINSKKDLSKSLKKSSYIYDVIKEIIIEDEYNINFKSLVKDINTYQRKNKIYFSYEEISTIKEILLKR